MHAAKGEDVGSIGPHSPDLTPELQRLAEEIGAGLRAKYRGKSNAILAAKICEGYAKIGMKITRHELCPMINWLRSNGAQIGICKRGYYYCETEEEKRETIDNLRGRIIGMQRAIEGLEAA